MNPLITVIVPIYNVEMYLERCVRSIINQTYKNLEIILVDDGSPDKCPLICDELKKTDDRIVIIHKSNGGLSDARNAGIDIAKGSYLSFVDSDDYIEPEMYEVMIKELLSNHCQIACCGRNIVSGNKKTPRHWLTHKRVYSKEDALKELLSFGCIEEAAWDKLYKKELFSDIRFPKGEINEDIAIMPWLFNKCDYIVHVGKGLYNYCNNPGSITKSHYSQKFSICIEHINKVVSYVQALDYDYSDELGAFKARYGLALITMMIGSSNSKKKYPNDYKFYKKLLNENYRYLLKNPNFPRKMKIRCLLIVFGFYPFVRKFINLFKHT